MSSAFDTIDRTKLINVCETFLDEDELRLLQVLLSDTSLELFCGKFSTSIPTLVGSPQGDGLSPTLFIIYLEAALREVREALVIKTHKHPSELAYADDVDFVFGTVEEALGNHDIIAKTLSKWNLIVNKSKTEITTVIRSGGPKDEEWNNTKKLGSLLDTGHRAAQKPRNYSIQKNVYYLDPKKHC